MTRVCLGLADLESCSRSANSRIAARGRSACAPVARSRGRGAARGRDAPAIAPAPAPRGRRRQGERESHLAEYVAQLKQHSRKLVTLGWGQHRSRSAEFSRPCSRQELPLPRKDFNPRKVPSFSVRIADGGSSRIEFGVTKTAVAVSYCGGPHVTLRFQFSAQFRAGFVLGTSGRRKSSANRYFLLHQRVKAFVERHRNGPTRVLQYRKVNRDGIEPDQSDKRGPWPATPPLDSTTGRSVQRDCPGDRQANTGYMGDRIRTLNPVRERNSSRIDALLLPPRRGVPPPECWVHPLMIRMGISNSHCSTFAKMDCIARWRVKMIAFSRFARIRCRTSRTALSFEETAKRSEG